MTETQEAPQLTSTPAHTKLTATTQSHWKKSSNELSQCYRLGKQENTHIGEGLGTASSHEEQRRLGQLQGFETQPRAWEGGTTRFFSYTWSHGQDWKTLLFDLMPRSQYRRWRKMKSPHWVLNIWKSLPHTAGSSLLGTPTFTAGSNPDHQSSALLALSSHLVMSQEYQKVLLQQFTGRSLLFTHLSCWSLRFSSTGRHSICLDGTVTSFLWSLLKNKW